MRVSRTAEPDGLRCENPNAHKDLDYPWLGETFELHNSKYSVVEFNSPSNPTNTRFSAYRDYGRFGAFPAPQIKAGESLTLKYEFLIVDGEMPGAAYLQKLWDGFSGAKEASPAPPTTVVKAEVSKPAAPKR